MTLTWIHESNPHWDDDKVRIVGGAGGGVFDARYAALAAGESVPGEWWRVEDDGRVVGYGWLDVVWGDAEILLATHVEARGQGVGTFILEHLEHEARKRGLNRLYNTVRPKHPDRAAVSAWLEGKGFRGSEDGSLFRVVPPRD
ncbi:MAG: GNAT family N-acetyltransferase [Planctomycetota bacterium]